MRYRDFRPYHFAIVLLALAALSPAPSLAQDEDEARPLAGLLTTYRIAGRDEPLIVRYESLPAMLLAKGQSPDSRLPPRGWQAEWHGTIEVLKPGTYRFSARNSGALEVTIGGRKVLAAQAASKSDPRATGDEIALSFGIQPIAIRFAPSGDGAELKLYWQSDSFGLEPLPAYVLGHDRGASAHVDLYARGRLMIEEHNCTACHRPGDRLAVSKSLADRPGPRLTAAGSRLKTAWIYHWLGDPSSLRPEAVMPRLFAEDARGRLERYAVATLLSSQGQLPPPRKLDDKQRRQLAEQGEQLFLQTGCVVCHEKQGDIPARATLMALGQKTTIDAIRNFIKNPAATDPAGRMPGFDFNDDDALRVAVYLTTKHNVSLTDGSIDGNAADPTELSLPPAPTPLEVREALLGKTPTAAQALEFSAQPPEQQLAALGRRVMQEKRCLNCHELKLPGEPDNWQRPAARGDLATIAERVAGGCLSDASEPVKYGVPRFGDALDRAAVTAFLMQARTAPGTSSPSEAARLTLARLNCTGCHERDGQGGLSRAVIDRLLKNQTEHNAEMVSPPPLTGLTEKLLAPYLRKVLEEDFRSRPWMSLKMPRFARPHVARLPAALAALEGETLRTKPVRVDSDDALLEAGRTLVGSKGFGCTKCHDMLGLASQGTRGPELSFVPTRVNYDWYLRWMTDPQRIQPGTRMPTVFLSGQSPHQSILAGDPDKQRQAVWAYLQRSRSLPPPEGLNTPSINDVLASDRPVVFRTFLPGVTPRGIAIRNPNGVHLAFDAQACRLAYGWAGQFLNLGPVWEGRGGMQAKLLGDTFWTAPEGFPWDVTTSDDAPDFSGRGKDTSLGAELPQDGKLHPTRLDFRGYQLGASGPRFKYELQLQPEGTAQFEETITSLSTDAAFGSQREVRVRLPAERILWWNVATSDIEPTWHAADGQQGTLTSVSTRAASQVALLVRQQGKTAVLRLRRARDSQWRAVEQSGKWAVIVRTPADDRGEANLTLSVLAPNQSQAAAAEIIAEQWKLSPAE
jgi:mono/diheme cytochrome c family protein